MTSSPRPLPHTRDKSKRRAKKLAGLDISAYDERQEWPGPRCSARKRGTPADVAEE